MDLRTLSSSSAPRPPRRWPVPVVTGAVVAVAFATAVLATERPPSPLPETVLLPGLAVHVTAAGDLEWRTAAGDEVLLRAAVEPRAVDPRRREGPRIPFVAAASEGDVGGQRGYSTRSDDDDDGSRDEDPLDGLDNDGDGLVDEDFAAISDAMVVVHQDRRHGTGRRVHLECYHWAYAHLRSTVFVSATGTDRDDGDGTMGFSASGAAWRYVEVLGRRHAIGGRPQVTRTGAFVTQVSGTGRPTDQTFWIGLVVLDRQQKVRAVLDDDHVDVSLTDEPLALAVCAAESWLQLSRSLNEAGRVRDGVADPVDGRRVPWVVSPLCAVCRMAEPPGFTWRREDDGDLVLAARFEPGRAGLPDPDLLRVGAWRPGAPARISWQAPGRPAVSIPWARTTLATLAGPHHERDDPYGGFAGLAGHDAEGRLEWRFSGEVARTFVASGDIEGRFVDGRRFRAELRASGPPGGETVLLEKVSEAAGTLLPDQEERRLSGVASPADPTRYLADRSRPLSLSPELLEGWPNPFRETISIGFEVPGTVGEAFDWSRVEDPPANLDRAAAVPWSSGAPQVTVKIYSLDGQELVALQSASLGPGSYHAHWDGTDSYGRQVASGTYFCKLQMDSWSVTRRIVYLR